MMSKNRLSPLMAICVANFCALDFVQERLSFIIGTTGVTGVQSVRLRANNLLVRDANNLLMRTNCKTRTSPSITTLAQRKEAFLQFYNTLTSVRNMIHSYAEDGKLRRETVAKVDGAKYQKDPALVEFLRSVSELIGKYKLVERVDDLFGFTEKHLAITNGGLDKNNVPLITLNPDYVSDFSRDREKQQKRIRSLPPQITTIPGIFEEFLVPNVGQFFRLFKSFVEAAYRFNKDSIVLRPDFKEYTVDEIMNGLVSQVQLILSPFGSVEGSAASGSLIFERSNGNNTAADNAPQLAPESSNSTSTKNVSRVPSTSSTSIQEIDQSDEGSSAGSAETCRYSLEDATTVTDSD